MAEAVFRCFFPGRVRLFGKTGSHSRESRAANATGKNDLLRGQNKAERNCRHAQGTQQIKCRSCRTKKESPHFLSGIPYGLANGGGSRFRSILWQGRAVRPTHTPQIKKELPQTSWGSFFMPVVGVEPTRVISTRDFESPSSAIPTHRRIGLNDFYYTGFPGQNQEKVCVFFQIVPHGVKYMTPVLARRRGLCYTKVRSKRK